MLRLLRAATRGRDGCCNLLMGTRRLDNCSACHWLTGAASLPAGWSSVITFSRRISLLVATSNPNSCLVRERSTIVSWRLDPLTLSPSRVASASSWFKVALAPVRASALLPPPSLHLFYTVTTGSAHARTRPPTRLPPSDIRPNLLPLAAAASFFFLPLQDHYPPFLLLASPLGCPKPHPLQPHLRAPPLIARAEASFVVCGNRTRCTNIGPDFAPTRTILPDYHPPPLQKIPFQRPTLSAPVEGPY